MDNAAHETTQTSPGDSEKCKCVDFSSLHVAGFNRLAAHEKCMEMQAQLIQQQETQILALYLLVETQSKRLQNLEAQIKSDQTAKTAKDRKSKGQATEDVVVLD